MMMSFVTTDLRRKRLEMRHVKKQEKKTLLSKFSIIMRYIYQKNVIDKTIDYYMYI